MRVLQFYKTSNPDSFGGVEQVISQLAKGASSCGVSIDVLSLTSRDVPDTFETDGYLLHRAKLDFEIASTGFSTKVFSRFAQLAKEVDVIHYHFPWPFMDIVHFATRVKKPTVVTYHSDIVKQKNLFKLYQPLMKSFLTSVDKIIATSPNYLKSSEVLARFSNKVSVIPVGLDRGIYGTSSLDRLDYWEKKVGSKFFLFIGVLRYYKGLHILLEAAVNSTCNIVIVGNGPMEQSLRDQAINLGLKNVCFEGQLPEEDKIALLTLCYGVILPSHLRSEAFGISLLEGAMFGKPMISCEIGTGTSFINIDGSTGIVIPPNDPPALRRAMQYLWENPEKCFEMGRKAEARYSKYFTANRMVKSHIDLYQKIIRNY